MSMSMEITVSESFGRARAEVVASGRRGLADAAEHLLGAANRTIPIEEGTMAGSGTVATQGDTAVVGYTDHPPKLLRQHEDTTLRHNDGRRAKWLELSLDEEAQPIVQFLARAISGAL